MNLQDAKLAGLVSALVTTADQSVVDLETTFLVSLGATLGEVQDMWHQVWDIDLVAAGNYGDRAYIWLGGKGHTADHINERWLAYWGSL